MNKAFTLIELSIVIVIIGLIVGGVLGAQSLIKSTERRGMINQLQEFETSANAFKLEYGYMPGDISYDDCIDYGWSSDCYIGGNIALNENGKINQRTNANTYPSAYIDTETSYFFSHLSRAGMIEGNYYRKTTAPASFSVGVGNQFPELADGSGGLLFFSDRDNKNYWWWGLNKGDKTSEGLNTSHPNSIHTTKDAKYYDEKLDDGKPMTGVIKSSTLVGWPRYPGDDNRDNTCRTTTSDNEYNLSETGNVCRLKILSSVR